MCVYLFDKFKEVIASNPNEFQLDEFKNTYICNPNQEIVKSFSKDSDEEEEEKSDIKFTLT